MKSPINIYDPTRLVDGECPIIVRKGQEISSYHLWVMFNAGLDATISDLIGHKAGTNETCLPYLLKETCNKGHDDCAHTKHGFCHKEL